MIKAEVITHEGIPGPNWLDHCRTHITPARITTAVVILGIAVAGIGLARHQSSQPVVTQTHTVQSDSGSSLKVEPLQQQSTTDANGLPDIQAPASTTPAADNSQSDDARNLGGGTAPGLTQTQNPGQASYHATPSNAVTGLTNTVNSLTNTVNSTVNSVPSTLTDTLNRLLPNRT